MGLLSGCDSDSKSLDEYVPEAIEAPVKAKQSYAFAVHPLHNPVRLHQAFNPLIDYLNKHIEEAEFTLEASRNYAQFDQKLANGSVAFALPNPYQTVQALDSKRYQVIAKMGDDQNFRGIILVRKDSPIRKPSDLIGRSISYPAPTALAATMMPQYFLYQNGIDVLHDLQNEYVGSQESSIMNVYLQETDAAATWSLPWQQLSQQRPEVHEALKVIWQTPTLPNNSVIALKEVPKSTKDKVLKLLTHLQDNTEGKIILQRIHLSKFEPATDSTYIPVREFIDTFSTKVRNPAEID